MIVLVIIDKIKTIMNKIFFVIITIVLFSVTTLYSQTDKSGYRIANKFPVEGEGGWDFINIDEALRQVIHFTFRNCQCY